MIFWGGGIAGVWTQGLALAIQMLCHLNPTQPFLLCLQIGFCAFCLGWPLTTILLLLPPKYLGLQACATTPGLFFEVGSHSFFAQAGFKLESSHLCLQSTWDYRCEPPYLTHDHILSSPVASLIWQNFLTLDGGYDFFIMPRTLKMPKLTWSFPGPFGTQHLSCLPFSHSTHVFFTLC
jgi:hypothetical protein